MKYGARVDAPLTGFKRCILFFFFKFNSWNILRVRIADGVTPGYWLPALKKCIDLLPQFRVTISKKGLLF